MASLIDANITASFGSDAMLVICEFEGIKDKVTLLNELEETLGISVKVVNEAGFQTPRTKPLSSEVPEIQKATIYEIFEIVFTL